VRIVFEQAMDALAYEHAQVRLSAVQLIDELFGRSHLFRTLLVTHLRRFVSLAIGLDDVEDPLPPPIRCGYFALL
jgi:hypothetical protein